jgi:SWI/SNF-related matrix-associated actin-dependent regulator of chromatin subfamily A-like protein 1
MIRISSAGSEIQIKPVVFLGGERFRSYLACVAGAKYNPAGKCQVTILTKLPEILGRLQSSGFELSVDEDVKVSISALTAKTRAAVEATSERAAEKDAELVTHGQALYPFQKVGMKWLSSRHTGLMADEMGLGKTVQTLMALPDRAPVLVVCPAVAKGVWAREAAKWRPEYRVKILSGRGSFSWPAPGQIVIVNYDILPEGDKVKDTVPHHCVMIGDEIHATKSVKTKRTKSWRSIALAVQQAHGSVWGLSGTPMLNRPQELWTVLAGLGLTSESFGSWVRFCQVMGGRKGKFGMEWNGSRDSVTCGEMLKRVMLRRLRTEVLPDLPTKTWETVTVDLGKVARRACDTAEKVVGGLEPETIAAKGTIGELSHARTLMAEAKISAMLEIVEEHEEQDEPLVIFSTHRAPIDALATREGWAVITGDTSPEERSRIETEFQAGRLRGVGGTVRAAGVAITLTRAHRVLFIDRDFTPALNEQAEDRVCRIGQDRGVIVTDLVCDHPLDERIYAVLTTKKTLIESTVEQGRQLTPTIEVRDLEFPDVELPAAYVRKARFLARNAREIWAQSAIMQLSLHDNDRAAILNGVGFNKLDNEIGHKMYAELITHSAKLTEKQWAYAIKFLQKYHGQVGQCPTESEK